ncbi:haloacid dehalogenase [Pholiota molesta]|nr:haloacid dehalogenase [Pholiota molesta]
MPPPIKAFIFDVVVAELEALGKEHGQSADWAKFAQEWRNGYMKNTRLIAQGTLAGPLNVDAMHREILDHLLSTPEYAHLGSVWDEQTRQHLNFAWHRLNGWPDTVGGLHALKKRAIIGTLSNGNVRLLVDMAKHAGLPWDVVFSTELFNTFKPNPKAYLEAMRHLALPPENCAMVAAHIQDLEAAARQGMRTVYIRRPNEDVVPAAGVKAKADGGEVDYVLDSFEGLAGLAGGPLGGKE